MFFFSSFVYFSFFFFFLIYLGCREAARKGKKRREGKNKEAATLHVLVV